MLASDMLLGASQCSAVRVHADSETGLAIPVGSRMVVALDSVILPPSIADVTCNWPSAPTALLRLGMFV